MIADDLDGRGLYYSYKKIIEQQAVCKDYTG